MIMNKDIKNKNLFPSVVMLYTPLLIPLLDRQCPWSFKKGGDERQFCESFADTNRLRAMIVL